MKKIHIILNNMLALYNIIYIYIYILKYYILLYYSIRYIYNIYINIITSRIRGSSTTEYHCIHLIFTVADISI